LRDQLDALKNSAIAEDDSGFDPSGTSGQRAEADTSLFRQENAKTDSEVSQSDDTDLTKLSHGISSLRFENGSSSAGGSEEGTTQYIDDVEQLETQDKEMRLVELFPSLPVTSVAYTLKKCDCSLSRAMDVLLNHVYFDGSDVEDGEKISAKGIEGFAQGYTSRGRPKKGKKKFQSLDSHVRSSSEPADGLSSPNKWKTASQDIDFISSRTNIPIATITTLYHKNGASLPATITAMLELDLHKKAYPIVSDTASQNAIALHDDFPTLPASTALSLIRLTYPSSSSAHDLAHALSSTVSKGGLQVIPRYAPLALSDEPDPPSSRSSTRSLGPHDTTASLAHTRNDAFSAASRYHRLGKSDHLMGAAAGYYSQIGRDAHASLRLSSAADADALVAAQSNATMLDLHGVSVKDAVRISLERVGAWWGGLGERRAMAGVRRGLASGEVGGYRVVTGRGAHSEGGVGRLGPAVARALVREGWRVEVGRGEVVVTGRR
ncbi:hypothetical protein LTS18_004501, partial [Coniosporium uncinatum]